MALASLTIDLIANLSRFEGDMGRAAQIATRDGERMTKAAQAVERALQKQADQVGRTQAEYLALKAAEAGLGEGIQKYIDIVARSGTVTSSANATSAASFGAVGAAAETSADRQKRANVELVTSIRQVNEAYAEQRRALVAQESSGAITTDKFKVDLSGLTARRNAAVEQLKLTSAQQIADAEVVATEVAGAESRRAAALKIVDAQNGITASYRQQLQALRELRDAGALTPAQFKQAGTDLVNKQPVVQQRAAADAADAQADQAAANAQAKRLTQFEALRQSIAQKNYSTAQAAADAERVLAEKTATAEADVLAKRGIAAQRLYDTVSRLAYESSQKQIAAAESAATAEAAIQAKRNQAFEQLRANVSKQNYDEGVAAKRAAAKEIEDAAKRVAAATEQQAAAQARAAASFKASVETEAATIGKSRAEILAYKAAQLGLTEQLSGQIRAIAAADDALVKYGHHAGLAAGQVGLNTNQLLTLKYTLSDVVASLGSGISPFTILTQQGGQLAQIEGGIGGIFRGLVSYINPVTVALGAVTVGLGAFVFAAYEGEQQSKRFADAVVLSGNFAGQTAGKFTAATREIAASGQVSVSAARDFGEALIATGQIGPTVFKSATEAAVRYGAATGKNAKDVASDFASMGEDVFKWATEHNKQLNFASQAELEHIRVLQETGRGVEAQAEVYGKLVERFRGLEPNLGTLDRLLKTVSTTWAQFWDSAFDVGRAQTIEEKIASARRAAAGARDFLEREKNGQVDNNQRVEVGGGTNPNGTVTRRPGTDRNAVENADETIRILNRSQATIEGNVAATAELARLNKDVGADTSVINGFQRQAKAAAGLNRELLEMNARFARQDQLAAKDPAFASTAAFTSKADRATILAKIRENYTDKPAASAADQQRKALLDQDLKTSQDGLAREKQALAFGQQELQALYNAGAVSLSDYYDRKRANIATGVQKELNELTDEQARLEVELERGKFKTPAEKTDVQTKLNQVVAQSAKVAAQASQDVKIANIEEGESFRQLGLRVQDFRAQLAQLGGDDDTAAQLRAKSAIDNLLRQQTQSAGRPDAITDDEVDAFKRRTAAANEFQSIQRKLGETNARESTQEAAYLLRAQQSGAGLAEVENGVYLIRSAQLSQLGELRDRAQALADASTDPKVQQFARDLALSYEKAAEAVDPAVTRIRDAGKELADGLAADIAGVQLKYTNFNDFVDSIGKNILTTVNKYFVQAPLQQALEGYLRKFTDQVSGVKGPTGEAAKQAALESAALAQDTNKTAVIESTGAMFRLSSAAETAASALLRVSSSGSVGGIQVSSSGYAFGTSPGATGGTPGAGSGFAGSGGYDFMLADGTNYVPYDGMKAILHKGESVTPAKYNPAAGGQGAGSSGLTVNVHPAPGTAHDRTEQNDDGSVEIFMKATEDRIAGNFARGRSPLNSAAKSRGISQSRGLAKRG